MLIMQTDGTQLQNPCAIPSRLLRLTRTHSVTHSAVGPCKVAVEMCADALEIAKPGRLLHALCVSFSAGLNGRSAAWDIAACFSNLFVPYNLQSSSVANKLGMVCPGLALQRPANLSALTTAFNFNFVQADPLLFSYYNCTCAKPLNPFYYTDAAGECP